MKKQLTFAQITNSGSRSINEDSIGVSVTEDKKGFIVCDGLGGHGLGDVASKIAVDTFSEQMSCEQECRDIIIQTFEKAQEKILQEQKDRSAANKLKTTAVIAVTDKKRAYIGHIGDSRLYIFKRNKVLKRTIDHSMPQMLVLSKQIKEKDIRNHPDRNILLHVIGTKWKKTEYELMKPIPLRKIQALLLCSDGFWELIDEEDMCLCLKTAKDVTEWCNSMASIVEKNGVGRSMDNFSAIAVWNKKKE